MTIANRRGIRYGSNACGPTDAHKARKGKILPQWMMLETIEKTGKSFGKCICRLPLLQGYVHKGYGMG
eukprot:6193279-Pleurochrysis_carterae.AAC.1